MVWSCKHYSHIGVFSFMKQNSKCYSYLLLYHNMTCKKRWEWNLNRSPFRDIWFLDLWSKITSFFTLVFEVFAHFLSCLCILFWGQYFLWIWRSIRIQNCLRIFSSSNGLSATAVQTLDVRPILAIF